MEVGIGLWLVVRPGSRRALAASVGWAVAVWLLGEGMGGLLTGESSILSDFPGAALLYAVIAVVLFPGSRTIAATCWYLRVFMRAHGPTA